MKRKEEIIIIGNMGINSCTSEKISKFAEENDIKVENLNPFAPEPTMIISNPERKFREEIKNMKYYEKSKSKYHK